MKNRNRLYFLSALTLTLLVSGMRTACLLTSYDSDVGYWASTPITVITTVLYILTAAWFLAAPLLLKKEELTDEVSTARLICGKLGGSLVLFAGLCLTISLSAEGDYASPIPTALRPAVAVLALLSSAFFFTSGPRKAKLRTAHAACGFLFLVFLFAFLFYVYFDMYVTINSPLKNALQLSILSSMLFALGEIRESIGRPPLPLSTPIKLLCALACLPTAISHLIFERSSLCGRFEENLLSPFLSLILLAVGIYALSTFPFGKFLASDEKNSQKPLDKNEEA
jgi:hypothetical protein